MRHSLFQRKSAPAPQEAATDMQENAALESRLVTPLFDGQAVYGGLHWYQTHYRRAMQLALVLSCVLCLSVVVIGILIWTRPTPVFFAATPDLRLAPMVPLDKPVLTQQGLLNWATETVTNAVSLDFLEWRKKLTAAREHFSEGAYKSFLESLQSSGILSMIQEKRLSASAVVTQAPVIVASGMLDGKASWKIEFPIIISYESSQGVESTQKLLAVVLVRRASTVRSPRGVVVEQVVLKRDA